MYDVAIVGAGPAGACAALALARAGLRTVILEKMDLPRYKTCGGGVVRRAQNRMPVDIAPIADRQLTCATLHLGALAFRVSRPKPLITMTMRSALDQYLVSEAAAAGAEIVPKTKMLSLARTTSCVRLETTSGTVSARFVIGADGVHSVVGKIGGWPDHRHLAPALEAELRVPKEDFDRYAEAARFDFDVPAHGYAWVFPKRDHLSVGVLSTKRRDRDLSAALEAYLKARGLTQRLNEERHGFLIPLSVRAPSLARDRVFLVGDAAGLADPVTAEGISHAIDSGQMAAAALIQAKLQSGRAEALYDQLLKRDLLPDLKRARVLAAILYRSPRLRGWLFARFGDQLVNAMTQVIAGEHSYRDLLGSPRNFWQLFTKCR